MRKQIEAAAYHADLNWISNSMLKVFGDSRRKFEGQFVSKTVPQPSSKSMDVGTVAHACILEPHIIDDVCVEIPHDVLSASGARSGNSWKAFRAEHDSKILLTAEELRHIRGMFRSVYEHPVAKRLLLAEGECETSLYWECHDTGLKRRCRIDKLLPGWGFIDLKTTHNAREFAFKKTLDEYKYHQQAAFYSHGYINEFGGELPNHVFIAVEPAPPYIVRTYTLIESALNEGEALTLRLLRELATCLESGDWSDPQEHEVIELDLPKYAYRETSNV